MTWGDGEDLNWGGGGGGGRRGWSGAPQRSGAAGLPADFMEYQLFE